MNNVRFIRCYGARFDPESFRGKGIRAWWIRFLNAIRFWIECRVIYHVLIYQSQRFGDLVDLNSVIKTYEEDVARVKETHFKQSRPLRTPSTNASVEGHLKELHRQGSLESPRELTARILERYATDPRSRRYAAARGRYAIYETEETSTATVDTPENTREEAEYVEPEQRKPTERKSRVLPISAELAAELEYSEAEANLARERLQSTEQIRKTVEAAEEHQRSVLP